MKNLIVLFLLLPFLFVSCSSAQEEQPVRKSEKKTVKKQKKTGIDFDNAVFVDVRTPREYAGGTFENAVNIPLNEIQGRMTELNKEDQIVVFCASGARASNALQLLKNKGFSNVINGVHTSNLRTLKNQ